MLSIGGPGGWSFYLPDARDYDLWWCGESSASPYGGALALDLQWAQAWCSSLTHPLAHSEHRTNTCSVQAEAFGPRACC